MDQTSIRKSNSNFMKIYFVNQPLQDDNTLEKQLIDGKVYHWCVKTENMALGETLQEFIRRKHTNGIMFIYDICPVYIGSNLVANQIRYCIETT